MDRTTVGKWFSNETSPTPKQDSRRKITLDQQEEIRQDLGSGKSTNEVAKKHGISKGRVSQLRKEPAQTCLSESERYDSEREELIAEGEEHLQRVLDCFFPFDDEVAATAVRDILGEWFDI